MGCELSAVRAKPLMTGLVIRFPHALLENSETLLTKIDLISEPVRLGSNPLLSVTVTGQTSATLIPLCMCVRYAGAGHPGTVPVAIDLLGPSQTIRFLCHLGST